MTDADRVPESAASPDQGTANWLHAVLHTAGPTALRPLLADFQVQAPGPEFSTKLQEAAGIAGTLARLQREQAHVGFLPLPALDYLLLLGNKAQVVLDPLFHWAGIDPRAPLAESFAIGWGRVASAMAVGLREALVHLRLTFAARNAPSGGLAGLRWREVQPSPPPSVASWEELLATELAGWDQATLARLRTAETLLFAIYRGKEPSGTE